MTKLKVAVIGAGILGSRHARVFHEQPDCELVGVVDIDQARAQKIADLYKAKAFTDYNLLLKNEAVDIVSIATPDHLHRDPVIAALNAKKHIFLEKPIATTAADSREIAEASTKAGVTMMINYSQRYLNDYAWI